MALDTRLRRFFDTKEHRALTTDTVKAEAKEQTQLLCPIYKTANQPYTLHAPWHFPVIHLGIPRPSHIPHLRLS